MIGRLSTHSVSSCAARPCRSSCVPTQRAVSSRRILTSASYQPQPQPGDRRVEPNLQRPLVTPSGSAAVNGNKAEESPIEAIADVLVGTAQKTAASIKQDAEAVLEAVSDTAEDVKENAQSTADKVEDNAFKTAEQMKQKTRDAAADTRDSSRTASEKARENIDQYRDAANKTNRGVTDTKNQIADAQRGFLAGSPSSPLQSNTSYTEDRMTAAGREMRDAGRDASLSVSGGVYQAQAEDASLGDKASETWEDVKDAGKAVGQSIKRGVVATADAASDTTAEAVDVAKDVGSDIKSDAKAIGRNVGRKIDSGIDRAAARVDSATSAGSDSSSEGRRFEAILDTAEDDATSAVDKASTDAKRSIKKTQQKVDRFGTL